MNRHQKKLFDAWNAGELASGEFRRQFPADSLDSLDFLRAEISQALDFDSDDALDDAAQLVLSSRNDHVLELLNELLVTPGHRQHQSIAKRLQDFGDPSTIPFVRRALEMGLGHLAYTCSEPEVIGKWYSWLLVDIGTPEAIETIREYAASDFEPLASAMRYRLGQVARYGLPRDRRHERRDRTM